MSTWFEFLCLNSSLRYHFPPTKPKSDMSEGHFSRLAPGDGLSTAHAASTQISLKFSKPDPTTAAEDIPEHDESEIPFDPRPLHIILGERKAMIDAAFDEYFRLGNRIAKIEGMSLCIL